MQFLESTRQKAFWVIDFLKGSPVRKNYNEIKLINENYSSPTSQKLRAKILQDFIKHAVDTTSFYKAFSDKAAIEDFPVINKVSVKENYDAFMSSAFKNLKKFKVATSGSSGTPFILYQNALKKIRNTADALYFADRAQIPLGMEVYFMRIWMKANKKSLIKSWVQNVKMQEIINFNDQEIEAFLQKLSRNKQKKGIWGYASSLENLCTYLDKHPDKGAPCNLAAIVATSEYLNPKVQERLQNHFNAPVLSRYSNAENGIFALQNVGENRNFFINWASYYIEILKLDSDELAAPGETGRIVISDLFNYCVPLLRYDTGDIGSIEKNKNGTPVFTKIEGRRLDMLYDTQGNMLSPYFIGMYMKKHPEVKQFQFIQEGEKEYTLKLNSEDTLENEKHFIQEIEAFLGKDCILRLEYIDEIPLLSSGKRKLVVNNFHNQ